MVAIGKDRDGLPVRLSVPGLTRTVSIVADGRRLGQVDPSSAVKSTPSGSKGSWLDFVAHEDALREAARGRKRLRASVIDGKVAAVVVPKQRAPRS